MIREKYRSPNYPPVGPPLCGRYVRHEQGDEFAWCETAVRGKNGWKWDVRQGTCNGADLPDDVRTAAVQRRIGGVWPFYVDWPL